MDTIANSIKQRLSLREPLCEALDTVAQITDVLSLEEYCRYATEYTAENGGKSWKYAIIAHDLVSRSSSFEYVMAIS
jgi:hypothetical protein